MTTDRPAAPTTLPTCDAIFADRFLNLLSKQMHQESKASIMLAAAQCYKGVGEVDVPERRVSEELFRFAYDHRHDQAMVLDAGFIMTLARVRLGISSRTITQVCMPMFDSADREVQVTAEQMVEFSGLFVINTNVVEGEHFMDELMGFMDNLTPAEKQSTSPRFLRFALLRDPELVSYTLEALGSSVPGARGVLGARREDLHYIEWAMHEGQGVDAAKGQDSLAGDLLRKLSVGGFADKLFVLGVMDQYSGKHLPNMLDSNVLERLQVDDNSLVKAVASEVAKDVQIRLRELHKS